MFLFNSKRGKEKEREKLEKSQGYFKKLWIGLHHTVLSLVVLRWDGGSRTVYAFFFSFFFFSLLFEVSSLPSLISGAVWLECSIPSPVATAEPLSSHEVQGQGWGSTVHFGPGVQDGGIPPKRTASWRPWGVWQQVMVMVGWEKQRSGILPSLSPSCFAPVLSSFL